ncbi:hypothetical protein O6H91_11G070800 [Diphasiastrum complanatum]|uniref:Uncharacterized protein n=2 Tax=Diphasiastrum complanatum TaxID=34168 RepID=A0ACC2C9V9_DIPCM|nr:hypothetical protein O6H91_11G063500 [Diphasiastrum complanatum]KAJ7538963.1 hypothetical protein O6H91_11G070800 [Diphasiastrum complanatum]
MGNRICRLLEKIAVCSPRDVRILMLGLDAAGKTTILYKLKLAEFVKTVPTIGFNIETIHYKNISFTVWDCGGQDRIRHLWHQYLVDAQGLIFVLDSTDRERIKKAKQELHNIIDDPDMGATKLLVLANKHDLPDAMPISEATEKLELSDVKPRRNWHIQKCSAKTGEGLYEGFDWLSAAIR